MCVKRVSMVCPACIYVDTHVHPTHVGNGARARERERVSERESSADFYKNKKIADFFQKKIADFSLPPRDSPDPAFGYSLHVSLQAGLYAPIPLPQPPPPKKKTHTNMCYANWYASCFRVSCLPLAYVYANPCTHTRARAHTHTHMTTVCLIITLSPYTTHTLSGVPAVPSGALTPATNPGGGVAGWDPRCLDPCVRVPTNPARCLWTATSHDLGL